MQRRIRWQPDKTPLRSGTWVLTSLLVLGMLTPTLVMAEVRIDPGEIVTLLPKDAIPAILDPKPLLVPASEVKGVRDADQVLGVTIGSESRAYAIPFPSWHEIINDTVGGVPVIWYPLCYTGIVYAREMNGQVYSFGVSGKLWANGLIMYDHQTDSLWSHVAGQAITGLMQGTELRMLPATCTDWGTWKGLHPQTLVLDPLKSPHRRDYSVDPYEGDYSSHATGVIATRREDQRLNPKAFVIGIRLDGGIKAYPFAHLGQERVVNDTIVGSI